MSKYAIWNQEKTAQYYGERCETYAEVMTFEAQHGNLSSIIETSPDNIEALIEAIYNETDVKLNYELID